MSLRQKHDVHAYVFYVKRKNLNITTHCFATPGFAENFVGTKENMTESGQLMIQALKESFLEFLKTNSNKQTDNEKSMEPDPEKAKPEYTDMIVEHMENGLQSSSGSDGMINRANEVATITTTVLPKSEIKVGCVLAVYAEPGHDEIFWLLRVVSASNRKIEGVWFNTNATRSYSMGDSCKIVWNNLVRVSKNFKQFFVIHVISEAGVCWISKEAEQLLLDNCN